ASGFDHRGRGRILLAVAGMDPQVRGGAVPTRSTSTLSTPEAHSGGRGGPMDATATAAPQHMRALSQANRVRLARAELKRQIAEGSRTVADVVLDCPWEAASMSIADLLMSQHRWGRTRCRRFLAAVLMTETKTVGSMTDR